MNMQLKKYFGANLAMILFTTLLVAEAHAYTMRILNVMPNIYSFGANNCTPVDDSYVIWAVLDDESHPLVNIVPYGGQISVTYPDRITNVYVAHLTKNINSGFG